MMHGYWDGPFGYGMFLGPFIALVFLVLIVLAIIWLVQALTGSRRAVVQSADAALNTLRERFARGEIDRTEFEDRRKALSSS